MAVIEYVQAGAAVALAVIALRALPIVVALAASEAAVRMKLGSTAGYAACVFLALRYSDLSTQQLLIAYAYCCGAAAVLYLLARRALPRAGLFLLALTLLLIVPGYYWQGRTLVVLIGWEAALSAYSYLADVPARARSLEAYAAFVFVNPTLAYSCRGKQVSEPGLVVSGLTRAAAGAFALAASGVLAHAASQVPFGSLGVRLAGVYAAHTGLASLQIGLVRQLGWSVPERYRRPYLATSPRDFWARWNTYVGHWIRIYVFSPCARTLLARPHASRAWVFPTSILVSFLAVGALHDVYMIVVTHKPSVAMTLWFAGNALVVIAWEYLSRSKSASRSSWATLSWLCVAITLAGVLP